MPTEPIWTQIHQNLIDAFSGINTANTSAYFTTVKKVYSYRPAEWDMSLTPCIAVWPFSETRRTYQDGSRTISEELSFYIEGKIRHDSNALIQTSAYHLLKDIHTAIYVDPKIGLARVKRVVFPIGPHLESGYLKTDEKTWTIKYLLTVRYSYEDDNP